MRQQVDRQRIELFLQRFGCLVSSRLADCFEEIMTRCAEASLKQDPVEFRRKFAILKQMWHVRSSGCTQ